MIRLFYPFVNEDAIKDVSAVLRSGWLGLGPKVEEFERKFSRYLKTSKGHHEEYEDKITKYCIATNSCTSALHLAMVVNGISKGDEVITTPMTFISTNHVILYQKAIPVFCDVNKDMEIDFNCIVKSITPKTKAIMIMHYGGNPVDVMLLKKLLDNICRTDIIVIEDAAHACGALYDGSTKVGNYINDTCFSFHAVKNLGIGDGGMYCTISKEKYQRAKKLIWLGINKSTYARNKESGYKWEYNVEELGFKYHTNDIMSTLGIHALENLDSVNEDRRRIAEVYNNCFDEFGIEHIGNGYGVSSQHLYVIKLDKEIRNKFVDKMSEEGIVCGCHYYPNHLYDMYKPYYKELPYVEREWKRIVSLPMHNMLTGADVDRVIETTIKTIKDLTRREM